MVTIDSTLCTGRDKCVADCIAKTYASRRKSSGTKRMFLCGHCVSICPHNAVSIPNMVWRTWSPAPLILFP